jgi:CBS domain-containing protein
MQEKKIRNVLVCDKQGRLIGLITASGMENQPGATAAEVMKGDPATVAPNSLLNPAITQLIKQRLYCLPVVDEGILVGVVTTTDVMMALQCTLHALQKTANEVVADLPPGTVPGFMLALHAGEEHTAAELETAGTGV